MGRTTATKILAAGAVAVLALAACGDGGNTPTAAGGGGVNPAGAAQDLIDAAKKEGQVVLYGAPPQATLQSDADGFKKAYGITVSFTQLSGGALSARVNTELKADTHNVDVVFASDIPTVDKWAADGTLAKLPDPPQSFPTKTDFTAVIQQGGAGLVYNTDLVKADQAPKTWNDLLDPKYKDLIVMGDPATSPAYATTYLMLSEDPAHGRAYFEKLAAQKPRVIGNGSVVQTVSSGEAAVGFIVFPTNVSQVKETAPSAPISFTYMNVFALIPTVQAILAKAPHPNAAKLFALYMMSREGQTVNNQNQRASSVLGDLPGAVPAPPKSQRDQPTAEYAASKQQDMINLFHQLY